MPDFRRITRSDVVAALEEYDELGPDVFLARHGFRPAREYVLRHAGRGYDSKAIRGVAHGKATGRVAAWDEFTGGKDGAAKWLRDLGFQVDHVDESSLDEPPATGSWREVSEVGGENARLAWSAAARDVLLDTAKSYHAVVTYKELSRLVQFRTGIRTSQPMRYWIGDVLGRVARQCATRGEPILTALCVNASGSVGDGYAEAVRANTGDSPGDPDDHAARQRLVCYQRFEAIGLPADGGQPQLTALVERSVSASLDPPRERPFRASVQVASSLSLPRGSATTAADGFNRGPKLGNHGGMTQVVRAWHASASHLRSGPDSRPAGNRETSVALRSVAATNHANRTRLTTTLIPIYRDAS